MPIYEYRCAKCSGLTEKIQRLNDRPLRKCPSCGGKLERVMSAGAFVLKGSGWYATDYAAKGNGGGKDRAEKAPSCPASGGSAPPSCEGCPKAE